MTEIDISKLSSEQVKALRKQVEARARIKRQEESLEHFIKAHWHILEPANPLQWNWHLDTLCAYLEAVSKREIRRLIVNIPPGTMKSLIVSVFWPAWQWATDPTHRFLCGSNDETLALRDAVKMRQLVLSPEYQENWKVSMDTKQDEKGLYANQNRGHRQSISMTSTVTGKRGDTLIIDDPHDANRMTDVQRMRVLENWDDGWSSRMNNAETDAIVLIMQRLHQEDLTGHLLELKEERWIHLVIPMRYEGVPTFDAGKDLGRPELNDPRTTEGELMFPSRVSERTARAQEEVWGPYNTAGQYQQRPSPKGGGELKQEWLMYYKAPPPKSKANTIILVDPAGERKQGVVGPRDNTAMGVISKDDNDNYFLVDGVRDRLNLVERTELLFEWHQKYKPLAVGYERYGMQTDIAHIQNEMEITHYRFKIIELGGNMKKEDRIRRLVPLLAAGKIWFPEKMPTVMKDGTVRDIVDDFLKIEYLPFPVGKWDDFLDMLSRICDEEMSFRSPARSRRRHKVPIKRGFTDRAVGY
jgi:phage terminase large subunit-like protein